MKGLVVVAVTLFAATVVAQSGPVPAPRFVVDLDADPSTRWNAIISQFTNDYAPIVEYLDTFYPASLQPVFDPILADLDKYIPAEYAAEIKGVAAVINGAGGMDLGKIVLLNLIYDVSAFCTSIVAQNSAGNIVHGRNLDYPFPYIRSIRGLQNLTITVDYQRGGQTVYSGVTFAGYVGILTGQRPYGWSITVNQRDKGQNIDILENLLEMLEGAYPVGLRIRKTLELNGTFDEAVGTMQHVPLWGPVYLTMAGMNPSEGAVITRDRPGPADVWWIAAPEAYYRGQTNDDHWLPPEDDRRDAMNAMMASYGPSNITTSVLYDVLSTPPLFNSATRYTTVMDNAKATFETMVRFDAPTAEEVAAMGWHIQF